jgi:hypothetical protein
MPFETCLPRKHVMKCVWIEFKFLPPVQDTWQPPELKGRRNGNKLFVTSTNREQMSCFGFVSLMVASTSSWGSMWGSWCAPALFSGVYCSFVVGSFQGARRLIAWHLSDCSAYLYTCGGVYRITFYLRHMSQPCESMPWTNAQSPRTRMYAAHFQKTWVLYQKIFLLRLSANPSLVHPWHRFIGQPQQMASI